MALALDQTDKRFERLRVLYRVENDPHQNSQWLCQCDCGVRTTVRGAHLMSGNTKSCGCLDREAVVRNNYKHGMRHTRIYNIWTKMKDRCYNPRSTNYRYYGSHGVSICDEWLDFNKFYEWTKISGYKNDLSIDRINVFGNYEPLNCRWATAKQQNSNTTRNHMITIGMETKTIQDWADTASIHRSTILSRLQRGWTTDDAVLTPKYSYPKTTVTS